MFGYADDSESLYVIPRGRNNYVRMFVFIFDQACMYLYNRGNHTVVVCITGIKRLSMEHTVSDLHGALCRTMYSYSVG